MFTGLKLYEKTVYEFGTLLASQYLNQLLSSWAFPAVSFGSVSALGSDCLSNEQQVVAAFNSIDQGSTIYQRKDSPIVRKTTADQPLDLSLKTQITTKPINAPNVK